MRRSAHLHKWLGWFLTLTILFFGAGKSFAIDFPVWEDVPLQDETGRLPIEETAKLNEKLSKLPHPVKIFVLEKIGGSVTDEQSEGSITEFIEQSFSYYELPDDQLVILLTMNPARISALSGPQLELYGVDHSLLEEYIYAYFSPMAKEQDFVGAFDNLITHLFDDVIIPNAMLNPSEPTGQPSSSEESSNQKGLSIWTWVLIVLLLLVLAFVVFVFIRRRQLQNHVVKLNQWKQELVDHWSKINMNIELHDVQEDVLLRLSSLETTYEDYKYRIFPDLDADFADIDVLLSRFRIIAAKELLNYIENVLEDADFLLQQLRRELLGLTGKITFKEPPMPKLTEKIDEELIFGEESSDIHEPILTLENHEENEKTLEDTIVLEKQSVTPVFDERTSALLRSIKSLVQSVNARYGISLQYIKKQIEQIEQERLLPENIPAVQEKLYNIEQGLKQIDRLSDEIEEKIPSRLKELEHKFSKVEIEDSAALVQIIKDSREKWNSLITLWDEGKIHELAAIIASIHDSLERGEAMIEQEYNQNSQLFKTVEAFESRWKEVITIYQQDQQRLEKLNRKYQLEDDPIMERLKQIEEIGAQIEEQYQFVKEKVEHREYKAASQKASSLMDQLHLLSQAVADFHERIQSLSTDEERYSQEVKSLRNRLRLVKQQLDRSLLPGKQEQILVLIDQSLHLLLEVEVLFDQLPLRLNQIQLLLNQAREQVQSVESLTMKTIENAKETEEIIRRMNVYRTSYPQIAQLLMMAENAYRDSNFDEAVTVARKAEALLSKN